MPNMFAFSDECEIFWSYPDVASKACGRELTVIMGRDQGEAVRDVSAVVSSILLYTDNNNVQERSGVSQVNVILVYPADNPLQLP